ncbi:MAG TPA: hypothetical protein VHA37_00280, partial [Candidatus Saccharimonadales bacterium]|nr:hypothetical protein [Candidatus Saccharimonadales bacterium]
MATQVSHPFFRILEHRFTALGYGRFAWIHGDRTRHESLFVGLWAAPILLMEIYNKMVKQHGS